MDKFGSSAGFAAYAAAMGYTVPSGNVDQALTRAGVAISSIYEERFVGTRPGGQFLSWPRNDAAWPDGTVISGVPSAVEYAAYEAALIELTSPGSLTPTVTPGKVKRRARVEGAVDVEYAKDWGSYDLVTSMTPISLRIEGLLAGLIGLRRSLPGVLVV